MASKIIVIGALHGRFAEAIPKLTALHSKNNFAFALLLGDVFANPSECTPTDDLALEALLRNDTPFPLPTYFTLGASALPPSVAAAIEANAGEVAENLFFLGKASALKTSEGIRIVAVGGTHDANLISGSTPETALAPFYTAADTAPLKGQNAADIIISYDWPALIETHAGAAPTKGTSTPLAELASALRPRYHFVPGAEVFWEREPYRNSLRASESQEDRRVSRFYALGDWGNAPKAKSLFAFSIDLSTAATSAPNSTASPYQSLDSAPPRGVKRAAEGTFFWGEHTGGGGERRHHGRKKGRSQGPPPGPENCFFCLSYPQLEKHLIVSIGNEAYLTTAKGPLTNAATNPDALPFSAHILVIPLEHTPTVGAIEDADTRASTLAEMQRYRHAVEAMLATRGCGAVTFEIRRQAGVHAHWQIVPVKTELLDTVDAAFDAAAKEALGTEFETEEAVGEDGDAFRYWVSGVEAGGRAVKLEPGEYFDLQFGRRVLAGVIGAKGGVNWRDCVLAVEDEKKDANAFKEAFKSFDFSLEE